MIQEMIDESKKKHNVPETPTAVKEIECPESPVKQPRKVAEKMQSEPMKKTTESGEFVLRGYN